MFGKLAYNHGMKRQYHFQENAQYIYCASQITLHSKCYLSKTIMHTHKTDTSIWRNTRQIETLVLSTTTSGQLSSTPENDSRFTSRNTDGRCFTPAIHLPVKNSHVRRHRNHPSITPASGNGTTTSTQLSANISA